jgi:hypothetical protein
MPKYQRRKLDVEAFQLSSEAIADRINWPAWLEAATKRNRTEIGALFLQQEGIFLNVLVVRYKASVKVAPQDWFVLEPDGKLVVMRPEAFEALYEPAPD